MEYKVNSKKQIITLLFKKEGKTKEEKVIGLLEKSGITIVQDNHTISKELKKNKEAQELNKRENEELNSRIKNIEEKVGGMQSKINENSEKT